MEMTIAGERALSASPAQADKKDTVAATQAAGEFLIFRLGDEEYGVDILRVQEIRSYEAPTRIANAPDFIKGVINLRGVIVPIVDLRLKFALSSAQYNDLTVVVMLNLSNRIVGAVVDAVSDVLALDQAHIRPTPDIGQATDTGFITGIGSAMNESRERMLILVDIERMISSAEFSLPDIGLDQ